MGRGRGEDGDVTRQVFPSSEPQLSLEKEGAEAGRANQVNAEWACVCVPTRVYVRVGTCVGRVPGPLNPCLSTEGAGQVPGAHVTSEERLTRTSPWAARELEGTGPAPQKPRAGTVLGHSPAGILRPGSAPLGGPSRSSRHAGWASRGSRAEAGPAAGWSGSIAACLHRLCGSERPSAASLSQNGHPF